MAGQNMIFGYEILADPEPVLDLYARSHEHPLDPAVFDWKYLQNPHGKAVGWTCRETENGPLIGLAPLFPRFFKTGEKTYTAGQSADVMVCPNHQRKGIFTQLLKNMVDQFEEAGFDFSFAFPNPLSVGAFLKVPPFEKIITLTPYRKFWTGKTFGARVFKAKMLAKAAEPLVRVWLARKDKLKAPPLSVTEGVFAPGAHEGWQIDSPWLQWRGRAPGLTFRSLTWPGGGALLRQTQNTFMLYALKLGPQAPEALAGLLHWLKDQKTDALYVNAHVSEETAELFHEAGFLVSGEEAEPVVYAAHKEELKFGYNPNAHVFYRGDMDVP